MLSQCDLILILMRMNGVIGTRLTPEGGGNLPTTWTASHV